MVRLQVSPPDESCELVPGTGGRPVESPMASCNVIVVVQPGGASETGENRCKALIKKRPTQ